jgi:hypothetical protein
VVVTMTNGPELQDMDSKSVKTRNPYQSRLPVRRTVKPVKPEPNPQTAMSIGTVMMTGATTTAMMILDVLVITTTVAGTIVMTIIVVEAATTGIGIHGGLTIGMVVTEADMMTDETTIVMIETGIAEMMTETETETETATAIARRRRRHRRGGLRRVVVVVVE